MLVLAIHNLLSAIFVVTPRINFMGISKVSSLQTGSSFDASSSSESLGRTANRSSIIVPLALAAKSSFEAVGEGGSALIVWSIRYGVNGVKTSTLDRRTGERDGVSGESHTSLPVPGEEATDTASDGDTAMGLSGTKVKAYLGLVALGVVGPLMV